jgi:hypothetical protein
MEETVSRDDVSRGARFFEDADCRLGHRVVCNDIIVAREKDAGLGAVENMISRDTRLIALNDSFRSIAPLFPSKKILTWLMPAVLPETSTLSDWLMRTLVVQVEMSVHAAQTPRL